MNTFAYFLKKRRMDLKLSPRQAADYAGLSVSVLTDMENPYLKDDIRLSALKSILTLYGATVGVVKYDPTVQEDLHQVSERFCMDGDYNYTLSEFLPWRRRQLGFTQGELSRRSGCGLRQLRRLEQDPDADFNVGTLKKVLKALGFLLRPVWLPDASNIEYDRSWIGSWTDARLSQERRDSMKGSYEKARELVLSLKRDLEKSVLYDPKQVSCYVYRTGGDFRVNPDGVKVDMTLSNMTGGYSISLDGLVLPSTEHWYQMAHFRTVDDSGNIIPETYDLQAEMLGKSVVKGKPIDYSKNAYLMKHTFMKGYNWTLVRQDFREWRVEYMLYLNCLKCIQYPSFRKNLMQIPLDAVIIEDSTGMAHDNNSGGFWGMVNVLQDKAKKSVENTLNDSSSRCTGVTEVRTYLKSRIREGTYEGVNCMGKILTIIKLCMQLDLDFPINYLKLNNARITVFDKVIHFDKLQKISLSGVTSPLSGGIEFMENKNIMEKELKRRGEYDIVEVKNFTDTLKYVGDYGICYLKSEHKFDYYSNHGRGKILLCLRNGYKDVARPVIPRGHRFDKYDEYASSVIGVCLNPDGSVKAINSRYLWRVGGSDNDFTIEELRFLLGDRASEVISK